MRSPSRPSILVLTALKPENWRLSRAGPALNPHFRRIPLSDLILWLDELRLPDLGKVGGKNASLGEMIGNLAKLGVSVPGGFATTANDFKQFIAQSGLAERIQKKLAALDVDDVDALTKAGAEIRQWVIDTPLIPAFDKAVRTAYRILCDKAGVNDTAV